MHISRTIVKGVMASKEAILSADAASDMRFKASESIVDFHIRSVMCAPLITGQGDVTGIIQIDTADQRNRFSRDDLEVLASVACQAAIAVENAELHETAVRDHKRSHELEVAHDVLRGFLPSSSPQIEGYDFFHFYEPANELGGDYYDYIPLPGGRLAVVVADVSGKGIPASLLMARLSADVRYCLASEPVPAKAVAQINRVFFAAGWEDRFVTLVLAVLDPQRHELTIVDAGHPPAYLDHGGTVIQAVDEANARLPLGVMDNADYVQVSHTLAPGDRLVMYTDGISEAMNEKNELYGFRRLHEQVKVPSLGVAACGQSILGNVKKFVGKPRRATTCAWCASGGRSKEFPFSPSPLLPFSPSPLTASSSVGLSSQADQATLGARVPRYGAGRGLTQAARGAASVRRAGLACPCQEHRPACGNSCGRASSNWFQTTA